MQYLFESSSGYMCVQARAYRHKVSIYKKVRTLFFRYTIQRLHDLYEEACRRLDIISHISPIEIRGKRTVENYNRGLVEKYILMNFLPASQVI